MVTTNTSEVYVSLVYEKARSPWDLLVPNPQGRTPIGSAQVLFHSWSSHVAVAAAESLGTPAVITRMCSFSERGCWAAGPLGASYVPRYLAAVPQVCPCITAREAGAHVSQRVSPSQPSLDLQALVQGIFGTEGPVSL